MRPKSIALGAVTAMLVLAGCGGSSKPHTTAAAAVTTDPSTTTSATTTTTAPPAPTQGHKKRKTTHASGTKTAATTATAPATTSGPAVAVRSKPQPKTPVPCMVQTGLLHVGPALQTGTWQGTDPASHKPIYVDGPYNSPGAARQSVGTLIGVNQAAAGGVWEVSASLRGGTGPAVRRVAACLAGHGGKRAKAGGGYSF